MTFPAIKYVTSIMTISAVNAHDSKCNCLSVVNVLESVMTFSAVNVRDSHYEN